ncbi:N-acetyltransferase 9-like protein [Ostrea edulis]|uniref:N-acetyltransferase 9-like protein n=1 Tax=Ostrea edulis TaxID=37623 RepID=UPI0024AE98A7|nr:N-acetyltransferase 9-like protein [Ostrea edulis]XP_048762714.2 N-acetyltransferase 9-like protein [Ostrea edulis]
MKINSNTIIVGEKLVLVPYEEIHVPKYHDWMKSEELLILTASEPLTLEEEYEMQKSWRNDEDKCTFIVLSKEKYDGPKTEIDAMVGDVNLFFAEETDPHSGEINMMIADESVRRKGFGTEALFLMIRYGWEKLKLQRVRAKIGMDNQPSIKMFTKYGFREVSRSDIFKELTLELNLGNDAIAKITELSEGYREEKYK